MTGLEKVGAMMLLSTVLGTTVQPGSPGDWVTANWPILCAVVAIAVAWGALTQRMKNVEAAQDKLATKESVDALSGHVKELVAMWDRRHG